MNNKNKESVSMKTIKRQSAALVLADLLTETDCYEYLLSVRGIEMKSINYLVANGFTTIHTLLAIRSDAYFNGLASEGHIPFGQLCLLRSALDRLHDQQFPPVDPTRQQTGDNSTGSAALYQCKICADTLMARRKNSTSFCIPCSSFMRRFRLKKPRPCREGTGKCVINYETRQHCAHCRYTKGLAVGYQLL